MKGLIFGIAVYLLLIWGPIFMGGEIIFIDSGTFILGVILPILFTSFIYGFSNAFRAYAVPFNELSDEKDFKKAKNYFKLLGKVVWITALLSFLIGFIQMIENIDFSDKKVVVERTIIIEDSEIVKEKTHKEHKTNKEHDEEKKRNSKALFMAGLALAILPFFHAGLFVVLIVLPFKAIIKRRLIEIKKEE